MPKKIFAFNLILIAIVFTSCGLWGSDDDRLPTDLVKNPKTASGDASEIKNPVIKFDKDVHNFDRVIQGEKVAYAFKFKNTGNADLIIADVSTSCGCTVPEYTDDPVKPGEEGHLRVTFDSDNRRGFQNKTIIVFTNALPNKKMLTIKAQVVVPEIDN